MQRFLLRAALALLTVSLLDFHRALADSFDSTTARKYFAEKNYPKSAELLMPHLAELNREDLLILGKSQSENNNSVAAVKVYAAGLSQYAKDVEFKSLLGLEQFKQNKDKEAIATLKEALEINSHYLPAYRYLVQIYEKKSNKYELRLLYQDMLEKLGENFEFLNKLCELCTLSGIYDLSLKYCQRGIELNPRKAEGYVYLGLTYRDTGKSEEAEKNLKKAADSFSKSDFAQMSYAQYLEEKKLYIDAFKYYKKATKLNPNLVSALIGVGSTGLEIQKLEDSLASFEKACKLNRSSLPAFRKAAISLRQTKNTAWLKKFEAGIDSCH